jgi:CDGSH-type Zn-finger protein
MSEPVIAGRKSMKLELEAGTYAWCGWGRSQKQPFCDGSHKGSGMTPVVFSLASATRCSLCMCKQTKTPPMCDHSHRALPPEPTGP